MPTHKAKVYVQLLGDGGIVLDSGTLIFFFLLKVLNELVDHYSIFF